MRFVHYINTRVTMLLLFFFSLLLIPSTAVCQTKATDQFNTELGKLFKEVIRFMNYSDDEFREITKYCEKDIELTINRKTLREDLSEAELDFFKDTITINTYYKQFDGSTTQEKNEGFIFYNAAYDLLLNKYYKLALGTLSDEYKKKLVISQRIWLDYYTKEKDFLFDLYSTGLANSLLYIWPYVNEIMEQRVGALYYIYLGANNNEKAFNEKASR